MAIPVIDLSKLDGTAEERANTLSLIHTCCKDWGFFQLINHGIPHDLLDNVKSVASLCFKLERQSLFNHSKPVHLLNQHPNSNGNNNDNNLDNVDWEDVFLLSDDNLPNWPSNPPEFKETMEEYRLQLKKLAIKVMEVMDENLGLPKGYIQAAFNDKGGAFFGTKVSHYPPCPNPDKVTGLRPHTDAGGIILLFQDDQVNGLQILKDGAWIDVQPLENAIVINTGDQIEVLSNGRYKSVWHRVVATTDGNRRSIASFYNPCFEAVIEPAPQLVEEDTDKDTDTTDTIKYPKFSFGDYMSVYNEQKFLPKEPRFEAVKTLN